MKLKKAIMPGLIFAVIGLIIVVLATTVLQSPIIIRFGVRAFKFIEAFGTGVIIGGLGLAVICSIPVALRWITQKHQQYQERTQLNQQTQIRTKYAEDSTNPDLTRKRLLQAQGEMPEFQGLFGQCLEQMDRMDALQLKQNRLISDNDASYLNETENVLNKVEGRICQNFRNIINLCIVAGTMDQLNTTKVRKILEGNEEKLQAAKSLLEASVEWVNKYNADNDNDRSEVERWISVIHNYLKEE